MSFLRCALVFFQGFLAGQADGFLLSSVSSTDAPDVDQVNSGLAKVHLSGLAEWDVIADAKAHHKRHSTDYEDGVPLWNTMMEEMVEQLLDDPQINLKGNLVELFSSLAHLRTSHANFPTEIRLGKWIQSKADFQSWHNLFDNETLPSFEKVKDRTPESLDAKAPWKIFTNRSELERAGLNWFAAGKYYPVCSPAERGVTKHDVLEAGLTTGTPFEWNKFLVTTPIRSTKDDDESAELISVHVHKVNGDSITIGGLHPDATFAELKEKVYAHEKKESVLGVWDAQTHAYNVEYDGGVYYEWRLNDLSLRSRGSLRSQGVVDGSSILVASKPWWQSYLLEDYPQESFPLHFARHLRLALQRRLGVPGRTSTWKVTISENPSKEEKGYAVAEELKLIITKEDDRAEDGDDRAADPSA